MQEINESYIMNASYQEVLCTYSSSMVPMLHASLTLAEIPNVLSLIILDYCRIWKTSVKDLKIGEIVDIGLDRVWTLAKIENICEGIILIYTTYNDSQQAIDIHNICNILQGWSITTDERLKFTPYTRTWTSYGKF